MAVANLLSRRGAVQAHIAELDVFSEEETAICGQGTKSPPQTQTHTHTFNESVIKQKGAMSQYSFCYFRQRCVLSVSVRDIKGNIKTLQRSRVLLQSTKVLLQFN